MNRNAAPPQARQVVLANGLGLTLVHDPQATRAAALARVAAGSHDEPRAHPGLAHFLEHLLFLGGAGFAASERLMPWVQARGGRLNASTRARTTDYFFEVPAGELEGGLARLLDLLARPRLEVAAQLGEREVLEAEYIARASDAGTLIDAALAAGVAEGHPLRRFVAGRRASLAVEAAGFQSALRDFHDGFYRPGNVQLWLQGPQSLDELQALAARHCGDWPAGPVPARDLPPALAPLAGDRLHLRLPGAPRLVLGFAVAELDAVAEQTFDALAGLLGDEAEGGLLAWLGERGLCDAASLRVAYRAPGQALLAATFELAQARDAARVEAAFLDWLRALREGGGVALVADEARQLPPLEQLQRRARGLPAPVSPQWLAALDASCLVRLLVAADAPGQPACVAGFDLHLGRSPVEPVAFAPQPWRFAAPPAASSAAMGAIHLRWRFPSAPAHSHFLAVRHGLRPLAGLARRNGVSLRLDEEGADWALGLQGPADRLESCLDSALALLAEPPAAVLAQGERLLLRERQQKAAELPIRRLLDALPVQLAGEGAALPDWSSARWDVLVRNAESPQPSQVPGLLATEPLLPPALVPGRHRCDMAGEGESALMLFFPLPGRDATQEAAWRLLARELEGGFYQRLRVELNLGYALFCGFRQVAGWRGLLFAVQSPHTQPDALFEHLRTFLEDAAISLGELPDARLHDLAHSLANEPASEGAAWRDQLAGVDADHAQRVAEAARRTTRADLQAAHAALLGEQGGCWLLTNRA
ncbi:pyrroloquinoline quinone biosynthesis protein PqqF [Pseudomonas citronellolis]|uniref:pyrroloquinoline quinone biosynthesis protein PqqF n=1 Tax=Pseudomonas citronellolis TaxID=53408 RepID=UPI0022BA6DDB|nr:pyrroloquinoline quinone biosynthesis protein PqqF [Pseudomonas citronellolis]WBG66851.1 pyrroloquinoline quinone biosynthesis protein PqqF [Pseudomonas citronellolis]